jgi:hypothetical protein
MGVRNSRLRASMRAKRLMTTADGRRSTVEGKVIYHNSWVTDFEVRLESTAQLTGIGRSRSRVENEQFNVHKKDGYELKHN